MTLAEQMQALLADVYAGRSPIFEVCLTKVPDENGNFKGHTWKVFYNGRIEGFPTDEGTLVINHAAPVINALHGALIQACKAQKDRP